MASSNNSSSASGGISFGGALTLLFIGLKLGHVIGWSWWWVLSPLWIGAGLVGAVMLGLLLVAVIAALFTKPKRRTRY